ncbi:MAG: alpha/beta hydrolase [Terracidiphilus sp.]
MSREKTQLHVVSRKPGAGGKADAGGRRDASGRQDAHGKEGREKPQLVSGRWLLVAVCGTIAAAIVCGWLGLCLLFWQGSWQLIYHPTADAHPTDDAHPTADAHPAAAVMRTPGSVGLAFDPVAFATTDTGEPRLKGWWIPAMQGARLARFTVVYLHGQDGNLGDTVDALVRLHGVGVNVLAFDYRGYGASQFARPSEAHWRQDADWALDYLTGTRQIDSRTIVLDGTGLGANLALEVAAEHPELAGVVVDSPMADPMEAIFNDARARLVPARLLVRDRYDLDAAARADRVPVLWFEPADTASATQEQEAYRKVAAHKMLVWLNPAVDVNKEAADAMGRWLDGLAAR